VKVIGVILSWSARPEPYFEWESGKRGYLPRSLTKDIKRDENDWPLDENGNQYPIWSER
jgi:hypothetical protein